MNLLIQLLSLFVFFSVCDANLDRQNENETRDLGYRRRRGDGPNPASSQLEPLSPIQTTPPNPTSMPTSRPTGGTPTLTPTPTSRPTDRRTPRPTPTPTGRPTGRRTPRPTPTPTSKSSKKTGRPTPTLTSRPTGRRTSRPTPTPTNKSPKTRRPTNAPTMKVPTTRRPTRGPKPLRSVAEILNNTKSFESFNDFASDIDLSQDELTVFVPVNNAFDEVEMDTLTEQEQEDVIKYHISNDPDLGDKFDDLIQSVNGVLDVETLLQISFTLTKSFVILFFIAMISCLFFRFLLSVDPEGLPPFARIDDLQCCSATISASH